MTEPELREEVALASPDVTETERQAWWLQTHDLATQWQARVVGEAPAPCPGMLGHGDGSQSLLLTSVDGHKHWTGSHGSQQEPNSLGGPPAGGQS